MYARIHIEYTRMKKKRAREKKINTQNNNESPTLLYAAVDVQKAQEEGAKTHRITSRIYVVSLCVCVGFFAFQFFLLCTRFFLLISPFLLLFILNFKLNMYERMYGVHTKWVRFHTQTTKVIIKILFIHRSVHRISTTNSMENERKKIYAEPTIHKIYTIYVRDVLLCVFHLVDKLYGIKIEVNTGK